MISDWCLLNPEWVQVGLISLSFVGGGGECCCSIINRFAGFGGKDQCCLTAPSVLGTRDGLSSGLQLSVQPVSGKNATSQILVSSRKPPAAPPPHPIPNKLKTSLVKVLRVRAAHSLP